MNPKPQKSRSEASSLSTSKDGYPFDANDDYWKLNKDVTVSLVLPDGLDKDTERGFRATLQRYAEEASARHCENMSTCWRRPKFEPRMRVVPTEN